MHFNVIYGHSELVWRGQAILGVCMHRSPRKDQTYLEVFKLLQQIRLEIKQKMDHFWNIPRFS